MATGAVLITVVDGIVDYCVHGDVQVVLVDMDKHDPDTAFPDDVDRDIVLLRGLPDDMPWVTETIRRLATIRGEVATAIRSQPPPPEEADEVR